MPLVDSFMEDERVHRQNLADAINTIADARFVGTFTRDQATASGDQVITGVGFRCKAIIVLASESATSEMSIGFSDMRPTSNLDEALRDEHNSAANDYSIVGNALIYMYESGTNQYSGVISGFSGDGFTITWTRTGTPTGTITAAFLALG